jgi:hypothetical protein
VEFGYSRLSRFWVEEEFWSGFDRHLMVRLTGKFIFRNQATIFSILLIQIQQTYTEVVREASVGLSFGFARRFELIE